MNQRDRDKAIRFAFETGCDEPDTDAAVESALEQHPLDIEQALARVRPDGKDSE